MGKSLLLHLLAVVAGWGMVAALRPVVDAARGDRQPSVEHPAPAKTSVRSRDPAAIAAGELLLQRLVPGLKELGRESGPENGPSFAERIEKLRLQNGFDPAASFPPRSDGDDALEDRQRLIESLIRSHLDGMSGPDFSYAFRHGRLNAETIYDSLAPHLPGAAADNSLRVALYRHLAPLDPVRAAPLLGALPESKASAVKFQALNDKGLSITPDAGVAILASIPAGEDGLWGGERREAWMTATYHFLENYGTDYAEWVEALPAGGGRDEAAAALLGYQEDDDLPGFRRIRALISEPGILKYFPPR